MMKAIAIGLLVIGLCSYIFPGFNGMFFGPVNISPETARLAGAILGIGGLIIFVIAEKERI